jgi:Arc/MetJ family transcription regulator
MPKTTVELPEALLAAVKERAARDHTTLRDVVESALREFLAEGRQRRQFRLRDASVDGKGLTREFADQPFRALIDAAYEGRGA